MLSLICTRCQDRPVAYPKSSNRWCKECREEVRKERYDPRHIRDRNLRQNYNGFTLKDYEALFEKQNRACAICCKPQEKHLHVDHDHRTGKVRGLLCQECNHALGFVHDNPVLVTQLLHYLLQHSDVEVKCATLLPGAK